ncbi:hypothetical protein AAFF_G00281810 [Aldrovandia affinis]|uniref:DDE Tnp4 domain-containing protein n=1 Tax=Aldrovandia affinis TaxID=143900 RepID=A0AAD7W1U9_9TELE|nr:hypothetical protein AAFF_G00281810 [Aldrovandia affinis]
MSLHPTQAINRRLLQLCVPALSEADWRAVARGFHLKCSFPNCLGEIGGKRFTAQVTLRPGNIQTRCREQHTVTVLELADTGLWFWALQVGDGGFAGAVLALGMEARALQVPADAPLPAAAHLGKVPFVMAGDTTFPLMRPCPGHNPKQRGGCSTSRWRGRAERQTMPSPCRRPAGAPWTAGSTCSRRRWTHGLCAAQPAAQRAISPPGWQGAPESAGVWSPRMARAAPTAPGRMRQVLPLLELDGGA